NANSGLPDNTALGLAGDTGNNIWIASPAGGITVFDGSNSWLTFNTVNSNSPTNSFNGIAIADDVKYLSSAASGLVIYRGGTVWENYTASNSAMPQDELLCIAAGDSGCVWLGTFSNGLVKYCDTDTVNSISVQKDGVTIYPNPAASWMLIHCRHHAPLKSIVVYDYSGRKIFSEKTIRFAPFEIAVAGFPDGIYFLEIVFNARVEMMKFVKSEEP
ncbi:MAG TPA: T9SS type A sorting domain-containing protein, partial [Chitinophagales bacterium]|nr:T9SS type A sorting domain-containing protein [Chitinophagales bacterium]